MASATIVGQWGAVAFFLFPLPIEFLFNWVVYFILPILDVPNIPFEISDWHTSEQAYIDAFTGAKNYDIDAPPPSGFNDNQKSSDDSGISTGGDIPINEPFTCAGGEISEIGKQGCPENASNAGGGDINSGGNDPSVQN